MHIDYVRETYHLSKNKEEPASDLKLLKLLANWQVVDYCEINGCEKISSIASTMKESHGYGNVSCFVRKKVTEKQRCAIANFLLEKFGTARNALIEIFKISECDFDLTEKEIYYL